MTDYSLSDIAAVNGRNNEGFGGNGSWWIIILFLFALCSGLGNNNSGNGGVADGYVLSSDFATLQRQLDSGFNMVERRTDAINNGICDLGYTQQSLINNVNTNLMQGQFGIERAISDCCCKTQSAIAETNYNIANQANMISRDMERGFCATNQAIDKVGDRIIDYLVADKTQSLRDENQALRLAASQAAQNNYIVSALKPAPIPAYQVANPNAIYTGCGC